jgi:meiotic recombination protein REC8, fungi type
MGGFQLEFDADGNLIQVVDPPEPELPQLPGTGDDVVHGVRPYDTQMGQDVVQLSIQDDGVFMLGEDIILPDAEAFPPGEVLQRITESGEQVESEGAAAYSQRAPKPRRLPQIIDPNTLITKTEYRTWVDNYLDKMEDGRARRGRTGPVQAKKNAYQLTYGSGIGGIGEETALPGVRLPLADIFSGNGLRLILNLPAFETTGGQIQGQMAAGSRRTLNEAFGNDEDSEARRVRQRLEEGREDQGRGASDGHMEDTLPILGDDSLPEIGMEAPPAGEHHGSDSVMPWSRLQSAVPGSSVPSVSQKPPGARVSASPLGSRGKQQVQDIERYSDAAFGLGSDGAGPIHSHGNISSDDFGGIGGVSDSHLRSGSLDSEAKRFLGYLIGMVKEHGIALGGDSQQKRRWIDFEVLAKPGEQNGAVASSAFLHVLGLATKNMVKVTQYQENHEPFARIFVGLEVSEDETAETAEIQNARLEGVAPVEEVIDDIYNA